MVQRLTTREGVDAPAKKIRNEKSGIRLKSIPLAVQNNRGAMQRLMGGRFTESYELNRAVYEEFGLEGGGIESQSPVFPDAEAVADVFDPEDFDIAEREYQDPGLIVLPPRMNQETLFERMAGRSARPVRKGPQFIEEEPLVVDSGDCFRAFLAETTSHLYPANDEPGADIMKRIDFKMGNRLPQEWGMMPEIYTLLTMQSMLRGELQDRFNFTVMDGEPVVADYYIPVGHCRKNRPTLEWLPANMEIALSRRARFRRLLGGSAIFPEFS